MSYWAGIPYLLRGLTLSDVRLVLAFDQHPFDLHRIAAACLPTNIASGGLLIKAGFKEEGYAPAYLKINGEWRDHSLFGLILGAAIKQGHLLPSRVLS